jgi:hypothetical protein
MDAMETGRECRVSMDYVPAREDRFSFGIWTALEYLYGVR